jgi:hypothetical protein
MLRTFSWFVVAAACLLPTRLIAGGPPWLCLPIDGVTSNNVKACADLLTTKLESKISFHDREIQIQQHSNQWYLTFYMGEHVELGDVEAALQGSGFSVPRDRLRLFGHVILKIDARTTSPKELLADLDAMNYVSVAGSDDKEDRLLVTLDMPYPMWNGGPDRRSVRWDTFQRNDFASDPSTRSESPATSRTLPSYAAIRDIVAKHKASLKDIRWSDKYACRPLGCVAVPAPDAVISLDAALPVGEWNVEFTNGVTEVCVIGNGRMAVVDEPRRRSRGTVAVNGASGVITFDDDRVERWTSVGKRFVVEHWFPGSQFPAATPVLGIAERTP